MSPSLLLEPGQQLVASATFLTQEMLFVSVVGPAAISFGSTFPPGSKRISNSSDSIWQLFLHASHAGPIGHEVPVFWIYQSGNVAVAGIGESASRPDALLTCAVIQDE